MFSGQNTTVRIQKKVFGKDIYVVILAFLLYGGGGFYIFFKDFLLCCRLHLKLKVLTLKESLINCFIIKPNISFYLDFKRKTKYHPSFYIVDWHYH